MNMVTSALADSDTSFSTDFAFLSPTFGILNVFDFKLIFKQKRKKTFEELSQEKEFVVLMQLIQLLPC